jgi:hypothetical protein
MTQDKKHHEYVVTLSIEKRERSDGETISTRPTETITRNDLLVTEVMSEADNLVRMLGSKAHGFPRKW